MNLAHVHLLLNHVPTVGAAIAIALLILALIRKNDELKRVALEVFFVVALLTIPAYLSGVSAEKQIKDRDGVSLMMIAAHESAAVTSLVLMQLAGADRKSTRLNSSHLVISYAVFCLKKKRQNMTH